jgi:hypothetical protein
MRIYNIVQRYTVVLRRRYIDRRDVGIFCGRFHTYYNTLCIYTCSCVCTFYIIRSNTNARSYYRKHLYIWCACILSFGWRHGQCPSGRGPNGHCYCGQRALTAICNTRAARYSRLPSKWNVCCTDCNCNCIWSHYVLLNAIAASTATTVQAARSGRVLYDPPPRRTSFPYVPTDRQCKYYRVLLMYTRGASLCSAGESIRSLSLFISVHAL